MTPKNPYDVPHDESTCPCHSRGHLARCMCICHEAPEAYDHSPKKLYGIEIPREQT